MISKPIAGALIALGCLILVGVILTRQGQIPWHDHHLANSGDRVVARIGSRSITLGQVEQRVALSLYQADLQRSTLLHQGLQQLIDEELLEAEASGKGITVSQLVAGASQSESVARLANIPAPVKRSERGNTQDASNFDAPADLQEQARLRQALVVALRRQVDIHIDLPEPELPILPVSADDDPSAGPVNAPITIVEFSDYQCPYCKLSVPTIKEILRKYPDKVKVVYRDYPGPNHPHAPLAAEAAQCAGDQGRFWDYHDSLFDRQTSGSGWNFSELAIEIGLNEDTFITCLNSRRYREEVAKDLRDGLRLGVTSTPTFFINGRPLVGAKPFVEFQAVIDSLLKLQS